MVVVTALVFSSWEVVVVILIVEFGGFEKNCVNESSGVRHHKFLYNLLHKMVRMKK